MNFSLEMVCFGEFSAVFLWGWGKLH